MRMCYLKQSPMIEDLATTIPSIPAMLRLSCCHRAKSLVDVSGLLALGAASSDRLARLAVLALLGETKEVEVLNEIPLGASLVRGTKDISQQTTGEDTAQDAISVDVRLVQAASSLAAFTLGLVLVDGSARAVGSNAEGEGEGS